MVIINDFNPECITYSQMNMIFDIRIYYRRIMTLTRVYMRNRYYSIGEADVLFDRLYLESMELGNMLHLNFGRANSDRYSQLLSEFVITLRELITAQIEGNTDGINRNVERLYQNINERAAFKASINPYWSEAEYKNLFGIYVQSLIEEANALASGNFSADIALYDRFTEITNRLGDIFAEGVYNYITSGSSLPAHDSEKCITYEQLRTIQNIRMFWFDLTVWTRRYLLSRYLEIGTAEEVFNRLKQVAVDYTNELKGIYPEGLEADLLQQLNEYLDLVNNYITAQQEGNVDEINRIIQLLYQNVSNRAALQAKANPFLEENEWRNRLNHMQVQGLINQSTAFLAGDIARSLDIYIDLLNQAESMSDFFALSLFNYFTDPMERRLTGTAF